jgi:hypothetical protein
MTAEDGPAYDAASRYLLAQVAPNDVAELVDHVRRQMPVGAATWQAVIRAAEMLKERAA